MDMAEREACPLNIQPPSSKDPGFAGINIGSGDFPMPNRPRLAGAIWRGFFMRRSVIVGSMADIVAAIAGVGILACLFTIFAVAVHGVQRHRTAGIVAIVFLSLMTLACVVLLADAVAAIIETDNRP
jgi:hypothetical protein